MLAYFLLHSSTSANTKSRFDQLCQHGRKFADIQLLMVPVETQKTVDFISGKKLK